MRTKINKILVLAAAGSSSRMGLGKKKEYLPLGNGTVLSESAKAFLEADFFSEIMITIPKGDEENARIALFSDSQVKELSRNTKIIFVDGGATRQESVFKAICKIEDKNAIVLIHDAARPFVSKKIILDTINATLKYGAAAPAISPIDTQKEINSDGTIKRHLVRNNLRAIQTPQGFLLESLIKCHERAANENKEFTDDTEIWDSYPFLTGAKKVFIVEGSEKNKKITFSQDIIKNEMTRIGFGTDLHKLVSGRNLVLGGIMIPSEKGELGHSDGDALLHAISDALLGAAGLGDIGSYFPPKESKWKDADSAILLKMIWADVQKAGWTLGNLDCVIEIEKPKILPWRQKVIDSIAKILEVDSSRIFVKAKTNEQQDSVGQWNAVKTYCVCLLNKAS